MGAATLTGARRATSRLAQTTGRRVPLARRQLLHEPLKLALAFAGVAAAVALVALLLGLRQGINQQVTTYEDNAGADVYVASGDTRSFLSPGASALPDSMGPAMSRVPGVSEAAPITNGLTVLRLHDKRVASMLIGYEPGALGGPWEMFRGQPPSGPGEIAVDRVLADAHGIEIGDHVAVRGSTLHVVGLTDDTASWMTPIVFVARATANEMERRSATASFFLLRSRDEDADKLAAEVSRRFPDLSVMTARDVAETSRELSARSFNAPLLMMVVIAILIGALVIGLTTYGFVSERRREYGALKAVGERNRHLYRLVTKQALALAAFGLASGIVVAQAAAWAIHSAWPKFLFVSLPQHFAILLFAVVFMALVGALVPVRVLARLDPAEVFRR